MSHLIIFLFLRSITLKNEIHWVFKNWDSPQVAFEAMCMILSLSLFYMHVFWIYVWCEGMEICMTGCLLRNLGHMLLLLGRATHYCVHVRLRCRERHCISIYMPWASPTRRGIECTWPYYAAHVMTVVYLTL